MTVPFLPISVFLSFICKVVKNEAILHALLFFYDFVRFLFSVFFCASVFKYCILVNRLHQQVFPYGSILLPADKQNYSLQICRRAADPLIAAYFRILMHTAYFRILMHTVYFPHPHAYGMFPHPDDP